MWMTLFCGHHTKTAYFNDCYVWPGREAMGTVGVSIQSELPKGKRWLFNFSLIFPMWGKICIISKSLPWPLCAHTHVAVCVLVISNIFHFFGILTLFTHLPTFLHIFLYCFLTFHVFSYLHLVHLFPGSLSPAFIFPLEHTILCFLLYLVLHLFLFRTEYLNHSMQCAQVSDSLPLLGFTDFCWWQHYFCLFILTLWLLGSVPMSENMLSCVLRFSLNFCLSLGKCDCFLFLQVYTLGV